MGWTLSQWQLSQRANYYLTSKQMHLLGQKGLVQLLKALKGKASNFVLITTWKQSPQSVLALNILAISLYSHFLFQTYQLLQQCLALLSETGWVGWWLTFMRHFHKTLFEVCSVTWSVEYMFLRKKFFWKVKTLSVNTVPYIRPKLSSSSTF